MSGIESDAERPDGAGSDKSHALVAGAIFAAGLAMAAVFDLIARGTYDFDEFVYLLLGHAITRGRLPYRDFLFYHPPGIVFTMAALDPLTQHWWVWGRLPSLLLDAGTCCLVYLVARRFLPQSGAVIAGLLCACSPIMLVTGTRIIPDTYVMFFTFLAIYLLLSRPSYRFAVLAGIAFGIAVIYKYPAGLIFPACLIAAGRRRWPIFAAATAVTTLILLAPFLTDFHQFYEESVVFQGSRYQYPIGIRMLSVLLFGILLQPLGFLGLWKKPRRWWLIAGYASNFLYVAASQVYYHYMVPVVPFASILGAMYLSQLPRISPRRLVPAVAAGSLVLTVVWAAAMEYTPGYTPFRITSAQASNLTPVIKFVQNHTSKSSEILDDRPDLPVEAYRHNCDDYFWNDAQVINAQQLAPCLISVRYVIHFYSGGSGYPVGFLERINQDWCKKTVGSGQGGAYVYHPFCLSPYIPPRN